MTKAEKVSEWIFYRKEHGKVHYCAVCARCMRNCKQSFRAMIIACPKVTYYSEQKKASKAFKQALKGKEKGNGKPPTAPLPNYNKKY